ncbi:hypothetical protein RB195_003286 [Necator americanus]|uniref:Uncharacterized protein n=1 Tax=Necator americanus TaxID=51031 RepID=A0ABR1DMY0_NECAM
MLLVLLALLVAPTIARIPYLCTENRSGNKTTSFSNQQLETEAEAERRRIYEHCTEICEDQQTPGISCADCELPYEGYGCLRRRREIRGVMPLNANNNTNEQVEMNCIMECDLLLPDRKAQLQCLRACRTLTFRKFLL